MKNKYNAYFLILILIVSTLIVNGQITLKAKQCFPSKEKNEKITKYLTDYKMFSIDKKNLLEELKNQNKSNFKIELDGLNNFDITIQLNDIRSSNYHSTMSGDEGVLDEKIQECFTYKGTTKKGGNVRFSINDTFFEGVIIEGGNKTFIRQLKTFNIKDSSNINIYFSDSDIIEPFFDLPLFVNNAVNETLKSSDLKSISVNCSYIVELATDADYEYFQVYGNSTNNQILSLINEFEGIFESTFNLRFLVLFQNVYTVNNDPYVTFNILDQMTEFKNYWNTNRTGVNRDLALLFTGKDTEVYGNYAVDGLANCAGCIGNNRSYCITEDEPSGFTPAHEIAHNLGAYDNPSDGNCNGTCGTHSFMCNHGCQDWFFSQISQNEINTYISSIPTIVSNPILSDRTITGTLNGYNTLPALNSITATCIINTGADVMIKAGNSILLNGGFEVQIGSECDILIEDLGCN